MSESKTTASPARRLDLHGLRGLAVLLVVVYHVFVGKVSGGVDVFLFLSAYFLTGGFMRQLHERQLPHAPKYWLVAFKRLLPPAFTVILLTFLAVYLLLPSGTHMPALQDGIFAVLQAENWWLISQSTDYYALDRTSASPYQHFWSLAIQSQIFIVWPLLFLLVGLLLRLTTSATTTSKRLRARAKTLTFIVFGLVTAASFSWSVYSTALQQEIAYFDTFARAWEFGLGTIVALLFPLTKVRAVLTAGQQRLRSAVSLLGVTVLVSMGALLDVAASFPGWIALWPLAAATLVIAAGSNPLLESRVFQFFGDISYAFYLVHWPLLVVVMTYFDRPTASLRAGLVIFAVSVVLAWVLTKLVDDPFRKLSLNSLKGWAAPATITAWVAVTLATLLGTQALFLAQQQERLRLAAQISPAHPGALIFDSEYSRDENAETAVAVTPAASDLSTEWWTLPHPCSDFFEVPANLTDFCSARWQSKTDRSKHIVYWGNSRLEQLSSGIDEVATEQGWKATAVLIGGCAPGFNDDAFCRDRSAETLEYLLKTRPDAVVIQTSFIDFAESPFEQSSPETQQIVKQLTAAGISVIALRDHARLQLSPTTCHETRTVAECSETVTSQFANTRIDTEMLSIAKVYPLDFNEQICPAGDCVPVIGNIHVFLDENHITKTYSRTLRNAVAAQLAAQDFQW
ncbi:acyltransferase family protein [Canibacter oris]|uniref:Peptidoglycan/LPS O-acetylase OafA/YrhL n=1 Tax=Canibacter oris TaxID=1365628 RepID=A0A840DJ34_9MICO|nr:acyltransferase family protein [Canibacter oris]MBB4071492.1 peptidoglycan/LPS O-acetylase OafA/YrhL [Canibacter oris]